MHKVKPTNMIPANNNTKLAFLKDIWAEGREKEWFTYKTPAVAQNLSTGFRSRHLLIPSLDLGVDQSFINKLFRSLFWLNTSRQEEAFMINTNYKKADDGHGVNW